jgi:hypothetical protein
MSTQRGSAVVHQVGQTDDQARAALADAIKKLAGAKAAAVNNEKAIDKARSLCVQRERAVEEAQAAADSARDQLATTMATAIADDSEPPTTSREVVAADAAASAATNLLAAARTGLDKLKASRRGHEIAPHLAKVDLINAVDDVLAPTIAALVESAERARVIVHESARLMDYLLAPIEDRRETAHFQWKPGDDYTPAPRASAVIDDLRTRMRKFLGCYRQDIYTRSQELVRAWETTRAGLKVDPATLLPPLPTGELE